MTELIITVGLKLIAMLFASGESADKAKKQFLDFIADHLGDSGIPVRKRQEYLDLKKKLDAPTESPDKTV